jgi:hypothetical protein
MIESSEVEIRLNSQLQQKRGCAIRGKPQNGAVIVVKVVPPDTLKDELDSVSETDFRENRVTSDGPFQ